MEFFAYLYAVMVRLSKVCSLCLVNVLFVLMCDIQW